MNLRAPFPYFGGKSRVAHEVWHRFGDVQNYVEPFCGSAAVLLARPHTPRIETVNDANCFIANFWRAVSAQPEAVAALCDWPVNEADLHARHRWLMLSTASKGWRDRMKRDPDHYDVQVAAWWVWGVCQWIGAGWCDGTRLFGEGNTQHGKLPVLDSNKGVHAPQVAAEPWRKRPHLLSSRGINGGGVDVAEQIPDLAGADGAAGRGIHAGHVREKLPNLSGTYGNRGAHKAGVLAWFNLLQQRLRRVRVTCGDWARVCTPSVTTGIGLTGVFLDPPYSAEADRDGKIYAVEDLQVAHAVRRWCLDRGADQRLRIALCGYEGEHDELEQHGWRVHAWRAQGGYANQSRGGKGMANRARERIWFSPHCLTGQAGLFEEAA